ncbi:hypothetical protein [Paraburkholderia caribensis]|uniref:hypothetical protein n=1 Tax=Paraburkholderia caribensis TaxID=75105 RepID=UPI001CB16B61|nr:hypothetical protein [Paraburkholderia caribensis]CAG9269790.1 conserved hypothetical protein [Paraburkholderia caribensis]
MSKYREALLQQALEEVWLTGNATIRKDQFYHWTGVQRIAKKPWRLVNGLWEDLCQEFGHAEALPLMILEGEHFISLRRGRFSSESETALSDLI